MPIEIKKKPGTGEFTDHLKPDKPAMKTESVKTTVKKTTKHKGKTLSEENESGSSPGVSVPADKLAHVAVGGGHTVNTGDFNSVKFSVTMTVPCHVDEVEAAYEHALEWVGSKLEALKKEIEED